MPEPVKKTVKVVRPKKAAPAPAPRAATKVSVYNVQGEVKGDMVLPEAFNEDFRPDLIHKAVVAAQSNRRQPYAPMPKAGQQHAVSTWGKGRGVARVQRIHGSSKAAQSPNNVGGRRAHPPKVETIWSKKMNRKERGMALRSALTATTSIDKVRARGHTFKEGVSLPIVMEEAFESIAKGVEGERRSPIKIGAELLDKLGIYSDIVRADDGTRIRAGRGKLRGRRYRTPKSILIVVANKEGVAPCFRNLPGVDVVSLREMGVEHLAPGGQPGRLTMISESAVKALGQGAGQ
ncbi:MAG: 50S ribosomal protein L4 [Euryarchaeota archaeon]|nr:50S ribosomal protein L4 [Euryarchaeota archaeon]